MVMMVFSEEQRKQNKERMKQLRNSQTAEKLMHTLELYRAKANAMAKANANARARAKANANANAFQKKLINATSKNWKKYVLSYKNTFSRLSPTQKAKIFVAGAKAR